MAYLKAVYNNIVRKMPVAAATEDLEMTLDCLAAAGALPEVPRPVRTLISAKRRLGLDPDVWITQYAICPLCWKHHSLHQLAELASPNCTTPRCSGIIYEISRDSDGNLKRIPVKIVPHVSLIQSLRRMVRRKGFRKLVRDSRGGREPHANDDPEFVMEDMHDGSHWHDLHTGIKRELGNLGTVRDTETSPGSKQRLTDHRFGLHLLINTVVWCLCN